jgi:hypothetical protein
MGRLGGSDCYAILGGRLIANLSPSAAGFISAVPSCKNDSDSGELSRSLLCLSALTLQVLLARARYGGRGPNICILSVYTLKNSNAVRS